MMELLPHRFMSRRGRAIALVATGVCLTAGVDGCFLRKYVYRPTLVANAIGDSTTTLSGTRLHVYKTDDYEIYGPTTLAVSTAERQVDRAYREFTKHFGTHAPPMVIVVADSAFAIAPADAGAFAKRRIHTFVYQRPHVLRDVEGVAPDTPEDEIWPVASRVARELLDAYVTARRHLPPAVEATSHSTEAHGGPLPVWFTDAVVTLLGDPGAPDRVMEYLRDHLADAPSITTFLDSLPSNAPADTSAATRDRRLLVSAAGAGFTLYLVEREGPRVVGRLADAFLAGSTARQVVAELHHVPQNDKELERVWRTWVREEYGR
jgi:hypothetical protein